MAITQALCTSYKQEILQGIHTSSNTYKIALYTSSANLSAATTAYTTDNEVSGKGYTAGGATLTGFSATTSGTTAMLDFDSPSWSSATITARGALIYNATANNRAVAVIDFGGDQTSTNGTFTVQMPTVGASTSLIRLA
jgi:hypothetical protein